MSASPNKVLRCFVMKILRERVVGSDEAILVHALLRLLKHSVELPLAVLNAEIVRG